MLAAKVDQCTFGVAIYTAAGCSTPEAPRLPPPFDKSTLVYTSD